MLRRRFPLIFSLCLAVVGWSGGCASALRVGAPKSAAANADFAIGADLSFLGEAEASGDVFRDEGVTKEGLQLFRDCGYTWVRLRLFHTPGNTRRPLPNDLAYTVDQARRAKARGYRLLLNFHYSDTWADPAHQITPAAWEGLTGAALEAAVRDYTRDCIVAFREAGAMPDMVQIGNEITAGMLWPHGRLLDHPDALARLIRAGVEGVDAGRGAAARPKFLVQIERSGNWPATKWFFDQMLARGVEADVLGQSYYPWWHGSINDLRTTLLEMARRYRKPIMVVEAAYCWRPTEYVEGKTPVGPAPFPETPEGQRDFLAAVAEVVRGLPDGLGAGVFWWEPAVGKNRGGLRSRGLFDDTGEALPALGVFSARADASARAAPKS
jgi:arabinogalactan endo-1,4-beta-galactosidase